MCGIVYGRLRQRILYPDHSYCPIAPLLRNTSIKSRKKMKTMRTFDLLVVVFEREEGVGREQGYGKQVIRKLGCFACKINRRRMHRFSLRKEVVRTCQKWARKIGCYATGSGCQLHHKL